MVLSPTRLLYWNLAGSVIPCKLTSTTNRSMLQAIPSTFLSDQARFEGKSMGELASQVLASRVLCSSVGNIDKLGPLRRWRPSTATAESTLVIDRLILTVDSAVAVEG